SALRDSTSAVSRKASSSDATVLGAAAGSGSLKGTTTVTVNQLARGAIATSAGAGLTSEDSVVAAGSGTFQFRLGTGEVRSIAVDETTTLGQLVTKINELGAGVTASAVNIGTTDAPDYRLRLATLGTGSSNELTIVGD